MNAGIEWPIVWGVVVVIVLVPTLYGLIALAVFANFMMRGGR